MSTVKASSLLANTVCVLFRAYPIYRVLFRPPAHRVLVASLLEDALRSTYCGHSWHRRPTDVFAGSCIIGCLHDRANIEQTSSWLKQAY